MAKKVLLGFSGGIDSTAAAFILQQSGYEVTLATLDTTGNPPMLRQAQRAAERIGLPWRAIDVREEFRREIIDYFTEEYRCGRTPAPCTRCNSRIKWATLYRTACEEGFDHIATGHYFRIRSEDGNRFVVAAADPLKDQSYYLWGMSQPQLAMALTPMGDRLKSEVKSLYCEQVPQRESMGVCFLEGANYREFLRRRLPEMAPGEVVDTAGRVIGQHEGYACYTIGQKQGLGLASKQVAVIGIDASHNRITVGDDALLYHRELTVRDFHGPDLPRLCASGQVRVKIRGVGRNPEGFASVTPAGSGGLRVSLSEPAWAPAKGQPVVFYEGDLVLGGGFLDDYR